MSSTTWFDILKIIFLILHILGIIVFIVMCRNIEMLLGIGVIVLIGIHSLPTVMDNVIFNYIFLVMASIIILLCLIAFVYGLYDLLSNKKAGGGMAGIGGYFMVIGAVSVGPAIILVEGVMIYIAFENIKMNHLKMN